MEIDGKLISFKSSIGPQMSSLSSSCSTLASDIGNLSTLNSTFTSDLNSIFKSNSSVDVSANIEFINQTISKVKESISTELSKATEMCQSVIDGIGKLEELLSTAKSFETQYNVTNSEDTEKKNRNLSLFNQAKANFDAKHKEVLDLYNNLLKLDSSLTVLSSYGKADASIDSSIGSTPWNYSSIYFEKDGVIYQKVVPVVDTKGDVCQLNENYIIAYNKNTILKTAEQAGDASVGQAIISFLNGKVNGSTSNQFLYDYCSKKYSKNVSKVVGACFDQVLQDTYVANDCKSISDYAVVAGVTLAHGFIHLGYGGCGRNTYSKGITNCLMSSGTLECSGLTRWSYAQGVHNYYKNTKFTESQIAGLQAETTPGAFLWHCSNEFTKMTKEEINAIKPGSLVSMRVPGNIHIGMIIGHTKLNGEDAVVYIQSSNTTIGVNTRVITVSDLMAGKKWASVSTPERTTGVFTANKDKYNLA